MKIFEHQIVQAAYICSLILTSGLSILVSPLFNILFAVLLVVILLYGRSVRMIASMTALIDHKRKTLAEKQKRWLNETKFVGDLIKEFGIETRYNIDSNTQQYTKEDGTIVTFNPIQMLSRKEFVDLIE